MPRDSRPISRRIDFDREGGREAEGTTMERSYSLTKLACLGV